jgi:TetR/AcrR family transcriptional repressor of nem operon
MKKSRDSAKTRAHILEIAFMEIYGRGFHAVGIREIATKAGLTIGAFFHHFPTKNDVVYAIIDEIIHKGILDRWIAPLATHPNPVQGILECFKKTFETWPDEYVRLGCPLNNLTQEMTPVDASIRKRTQSVLNDWIAGTERHLRQAQKDGYLKKSVDPRAAAEFIVTLQEGTFAMGKALSDRRVFDSSYLSLKAYLDSVSDTPRNR